MEYIELGPSPCDEECVQVGQPDYLTRAYEECRRYVIQLQKTFPQYAHRACRFRIKMFPHDFGSYYDVVIEFDDNSDMSCEFAYFVENELPINWDDDPTPQYMDGNIQVYGPEI